MENPLGKKVLSLIKLARGFVLEHGQVSRHEDLRLEAGRRLTERDASRSTGETQQQRTIQEMKGQRQRDRDFLLGSRGL